MLTITVKRLVVVLAGGVAACGARSWLSTEEGAAPVLRDAAPEASGGECTPPSRGLLLFGGQDIHTNPLGDTWTWDGSHWAMSGCKGPSPRSFPAAATLEEDNTVQAVLFGGFSGVGAAAVSVGDTWIWGHGGWSTSPVVQAPSPRALAAMTSISFAALLFGGETQATGDVGDTWIFDGTSWSQASDPGPSPRDRPAIAPVGNDVVLFGGFDVASHPDGDTWVWNGFSWKMQSVLGPPARYGAAAAELGDNMVMFGGTDGTTQFGDTWLWDDVAWSQATGSGPPGRYEASAATLDGKMILFGGIDQSGVPLNDTWAWDGVSWAQVNTSGPPPRSGAVLVAYLLE